MLGLLGTVTGMIMAFMEISSRQGNAAAGADDLHPVCEAAVDV